MAVIKKKNRFTWLISLAVMLVASVAVVLLTAAVKTSAYAKYEESQPIPFTIASFEELDLSAYAADEYQVISASRCLDESGNVVAYAVETSVFGFNADKPIILKSTVSADGTLLVGIEVVEQHESEYYGDRIALSSFTEKFNGRLLPVLLTTDGGKGSHVDGLAGATFSSKAVISSIDLAQRFVAEQLG